MERHENHTGWQIVRDLRLRPDHSSSRGHFHQSVIRLDSQAGCVLGIQLHQPFRINLRQPFGLSADHRMVVVEHPTRRQQEWIRFVRKLGCRCIRCHMEFPLPSCEFVFVQEGSPGMVRGWARPFQPQAFQSVIYEVAKKGNAVFFGKGSQVLLQSFDCALHVLLTGSMEKRAQRIMAENKVGREIAGRMIQSSDHDKRGFVRYAFDQDWLNPELYGLIINTDTLSIDSAVNIIVDAAKSQEIKACGLDAVRTLGKLSLQRKIESALLEAGVSSFTLFFTVEDVDTVRLFGAVDSWEDKQAIESVLKGIKELKMS